MSEDTTGEYKKHNGIDGYSKYEKKEGIPLQYQDYCIFVKDDTKDIVKKCNIGTDPTGSTSNVAVIFPVCLSDSEKYIGKVIPYSVTPGGWTGIINEIKIQNKAVTRKCKVPKIIMYFLGPNEAVIIMDKIEGDTINSKLIEIIENAKKEDETIEEVKKKISLIYESIKTSLKTLHDLEIYHGDSHLENFMYESKHENEIWIIDFGHSSIDVRTQSEKNVKILEDYMCLRTAFTILSKSKTREKNGKFILKGYSIYLEDIIKSLNGKILELEENVCVPCVASTSVQLSMRRSNRKVSNRKLSKRKVSKRQLSKRQVSKRQVSKRKVSERQLSKRKVSKRKVSKRSRR
jgi:tRNA A-37 threonylcarbamoyl transferase component Bud32